MNKKIEQVRDYVDTHDISAELEEGHWETDVVEDPMVTTSLRLPKSLLDWVRKLAAERHVKPSAWIRELLEEQRTGSADLERRVSALETLVASMAAQTQQVGRRKASSRGKVKKTTASRSRAIKANPSGTKFTKASPDVDAFRRWAAEQ